MSKNLLVGIVLLSSVAYGQTRESLRHVVNDSITADFYIQLETEKIKYETGLVYYWFKSQQLHFSKGSSSGYLLNGPFTAYYHSGQLKSKGIFKTGLKDGNWTEWYENGQIKSSFEFNMGVLSGEFMCYDSTGEVTQSGSFKKGNVVEEKGQRAKDKGEDVEEEKGEKDKGQRAKDKGKVEKEKKSWKDLFKFPKKLEPKDKVKKNEKVKKSKGQTIPKES